LYLPLGITIDTFVELRKKLEKRLQDTTEKCFICGIEKNTFNRTLDRDAFRVHIKRDQHLWNYVYFIIFLWEQDKDDDDGFESYARGCVAESDLMWFPMNKAIRLAEHQEKGDVHSLKYRFRDDLAKADNMITTRMGHFKNQLVSTIARVEKALEFEAEVETRKRSSSHGTRGSRRTSQQGSGGLGDTAPSQLSKQASLNAAAFGLQTDYMENDSNNNKGQSALNLDDNSTIASVASQRVITFESAATSTTYTNALEADNAVQLHLRLVAVKGLHITREQAKAIVVRVISPYETQSVSPSITFNDAPAVTRRFRKEVMNVTAKFSSKNFRTIANQLREQTFMSIPSPLVGPGGHEAHPTTLHFDAHMNPPVLCHEGLLPSFDLSLLTVKVQILVPSVDREGGVMAMLGGINIPIVELLKSANSGGALEVRFKQRYHNVEEKHVRASLVTRQSMSSMHFDEEELDPDEHLHHNLYPEYDECTLTILAVASHKLLVEWQHLSESWIH
jgi:hypothetical protein